MSYWTKLFAIWGKLRREHPTKSGHIAPAYLCRSNWLRASLEVSLWSSCNFICKYLHINMAWKLISNITCLGISVWELLIATYCRTLVKLALKSNCDTSLSNIFFSVKGTSLWPSMTGYFFSTRRTLSRTFSFLLCHSESFKFKLREGLNIKMI